MRAEPLPLRSPRPTALRRLRLNARLFYENALLSYLALFYWLSPTEYLASKVIAPLFQILFFTYLGRYATGGDASFYVIGNAVLLVALSGIYGVTMSVDGDRDNGTLPYLFATPANRVLLFTGRAAMHVLDGMLGVLIGLGWGVLLLGLDLSHTNPAALLLVILSVALSTSGLGLLMGALSLITVNVLFVNNLLYYVLLVLAGVNIPIESLPGWIQPVSQILPLTHGVAAARDVIAGAGVQDILPAVGVELLLCAVYTWLGFGLFRWIELQARRRATLELM